MPDGIGTYDLRDSRDLGFAFDYNGSGKLDHLVFYRPGTGVIYIVEINHISRGTLTANAVYKSDNGIGTYDLKDSRDRMFAFDFAQSGKLDHLVCYRPGTGVIYIISNLNGTFKPVFNSQAPVVSD